MRITTHPIIDFQKKKKIQFFFNKKKISAVDGDSIASALHANGVNVLSHSLRYHRPRGFFCGIGKCSSCFMTVENVPNVRTCILPVKKDIVVKEQENIGELPEKKYVEQVRKKTDIEIVIVGSGPAGLMAALVAARQGASVLLVDENHRVGGQLIKQTHKFFGSKEEKAGTRGIDIAVELMEEITKYPKVDVMLETTVVGWYKEKKHHRLIAIQRFNFQERLVDISAQKVIVACGAMENMLAFPNNDLPGVYGAGGVQTLMNVYGVKPGNRVLMVGAGNVGLIVSYQLLQAGVSVERVVEAMPKIGGYHVHAAKLRRCGVPIQTSHTIKKAYGNGKVEGAVVVAVDGCFQPVSGTEEKVSCDTICLAVGLTPSIRLLEQIGVQTQYIPETGGHVAVHDTNMQTSVQGVYVAGDSSGIEEASTAMIEGELAGVSAAASLGYKTRAEDIQNKCQRALAVFRAGPFGEIPRRGKEKIIAYRRGGI